MRCALSRWGSSLSCKIESPAFHGVSDCIVDFLAPGVLLIEGFHRGRQFVICGFAGLGIILYGPEKRRRFVRCRQVGARRFWFLDFWVLAFGVWVAGRHGAACFYEGRRNENGITDPDALGIDIRVDFGQSGPVHTRTGIPKGDGKEGFTTVPDFVRPQLDFRCRLHFLTVLPKKTVQRFLGDIRWNVWRRRFLMRGSLRPAATGYPTKG
jgi:hypothetical protein